MTSDPAIGTDAGWFCGLLQAGDSFYPTGAYAHSYGLEGLVQENVVTDRATLCSYYEQSVLPSLARLELPLVAQAWHALAEPDWAEVAEVSRLASVLKTTREVRLASHNIGRQRAELLARLRPESLATALVARAASDGFPFAATVSAALEGRVHGAPLAAVLGGVFYATLSGQLAAAMKLLRIGQNAAQSLLTEMLAHAGPTVEAAVVLRREEIGWFNPWLDIASARHETANARLFIS
ncbi:urease accessory protein UreF [Synoicihabitans lomoniglobus]|uniref:Urease accessory protein UreF n=1 Tax=Synoicihabitans lomoniglobus TaxID=2909285 RepID=A0AAF0CNV3_9BACT|nr:urease accessory protein UreF [Opitutaceae bacterium LMO-M01]WED64910.1 urease accessory UreF family protein [Opitutaceae bacterium LMO-M01]